MVSKLLRLLNASRGRILALAMLPVFVVGTLPQAACICADGHREAVCPKLKGGGEKRVRSCCAGKSHDGVSQPGPLDGVGVKAASCCRVVIEGAPATVVAKESSAKIASLRVVLNDCVVLHTADASVRPVRCDVGQFQPPPRDTVILFSRLTI